MAAKSQAKKRVDDTFAEALPDIAAVLGCSLGTVKSRLHHALHKLRKMKMNLPNTKGDTLI